MKIEQARFSYSIYKGRLPQYLVLIFAILILMFLGGPFLLQGNPLAGLFFNLILALVTTAISIYATHYYSQHAQKDELTRYGLQAWRNLDSLEVKLTQHVNTGSIPNNTLHAWILDVDSAKWAWRDLLRDAFELQDRLQTETEEVVSKYRKAIENTSSSEEKSQLEAKKAEELAKLQLRAPLPVKLSEEVACPNCKTKTTARVGSSVGDSDWPVCPKCKARFPVFRMPDGDLRHSDRTKIDIEKPCPKCTTPNKFSLYSDFEVKFVTTCPECQTHIQFQGTPENQSLTDLGVTNAQFTCPYCSNSNLLWISSTKSVAFKKNCSSCNREVRITGTKDNFNISVY